MAVFLSFLKILSHIDKKKYNALTIFTGCERVRWKNIIVIIADLFIIKRGYVKAAAPWLKRRLKSKFKNKKVLIICLPLNKQRLF